MKNYQISIKNTISIREFMVNYLGEKEYDCEGINNHREMFKYLLTKGKSLPVKIDFSHVEKEDILSGRYLLVRNERRKNHHKGYVSNKQTQILAYRNPRFLNINMIIQDLKENIDFEKPQEKVLIKK